jgi:hypothetical protein
MKLHIYITVLLFFFASFVFAQQRAIILEKNTSKKVVLIKENKRVKVETNNGKVYRGKLHIIDERTIAIDSILIPTNSIVAIKKQSLSFQILAPIIVVTGVVSVLGGVGVAVLGGTKSIIGVGMLFSGFYVGSIPFIESKHKSNKWNYKIQETQIQTKLDSPKSTE